MRCHKIRPYKIGNWNISIKKQSNEYAIDYIGSEDVIITDFIQFGIYNLNVLKDPTIYR